MLREDSASKINAVLSSCLGHLRAVLGRAPQLSSLLMWFLASFFQWEWAGIGGSMPTCVRVRSCTLCVCTYVCVLAYKCTHVYMHACVCTCTVSVHVCAQVCVCLHIWISGKGRQLQASALAQVEMAPGMMEGRC